MPLRGTLIPIWIGFLSGFLFFQKPWGSPIFKSWLSPYLVWSIILTVFQSLCIYEAFTNFDTSDFIKPTGRGQNVIFRHLQTLIMISTLATTIVLRLLFTKTVKPHAKLLNRLSRYDLVQQNVSWVKWRKTWIAAYIVTSLPLLFLTLTTVALFYTFAPKLRESGLGLHLWIGDFDYVLFTSVYFTTMTTRYVSFALIIAVTLNLGEAFDDVCDSLETRLLPRPANCVAKLSAQEEEILVADLKHRYDRLKLLTREAERVYGIFVLLTLVTAGWMLITNLYTLMAEVDLEKSSRSLSIVGEQLVYISLIFFGSVITDMIQVRQKRLRRILILKPSVRSTDAGRLASLFLSFQWKLNAASMFTVDRKLLAGIVSTAMNYTVILFQFELALESKK